jgi:hypothetical protein
VRPEAYKILGALFKKIMQNYKYKVNCEVNNLCITKKYKFKKVNKTTKSRKITILL